MGLTLRVGIAAALAVILCAGALIPARPVEADTVLASSGTVLVLIEGDADLDTVAEGIREAGGRVVHAFPPSALIAEEGSGLPADAGIRAVYRREVGEATVATLDGAARRAAETWNHLQAPASRERDADSLASLQADLVDDALTAPTGPLLTMSAQDSDPAPDARQTSEFFIGRVAVGIVMPASDGSVDRSTEDWTAEEREMVVSEIAAALDWWAAREPRANLSFVYDDNGGAPIKTSYEPISHAHTEEHLWVSEVMERKGYTGPSWFDQVYAYNNALRATYDTDWAFTVFVVDSSNDDDDLFPDGTFAYAYTGGPYCVMTYGNAGYGIENMDSVAAHEIGHIFHALDQHKGAERPCTERSGYLGVENQNSHYGDCRLDQPSIMRSHVEPFAAGAVDPYARGQIGWRDSDGDGILDPVDTPIRLSSVDVVTDAIQSSVYTFTARLEEVPYPSPSRPAVTINRLETVHYRVDGGDWTAAQPTDRAFDSAKETFRFTTDPLPTGEVEVEIRVTDSAGNTMTETLATVSAVHPVDRILNTTLARTEVRSAEALAASAVYRGRAESAGSTIAGTYYRIDEGDWQMAAPDDGAFDDAAESFSFTIALDELSPGTHELQVYSVDAEGNVEPSPATDTLERERGPVRLLFPLVVRRT